MLVFSPVTFSTESIIWGDGTGEEDTRTFFDRIIRDHIDARTAEVTDGIYGNRVGRNKRKKKKKKWKEREREREYVCVREEEKR